MALLLNFRLSRTMIDAERFVSLKAFCGSENRNIASKTYEGQDQSIYTEMAKLARYKNKILT